MSTRPPWEDYGGSANQDDSPPWEGYSPEEEPRLERASIGPAPAPDMWQEAAWKLKEAVFGHPDRAEARQAGIYIDPTLAEMVETGLAGVSAAQGGGFMAGGLKVGAAGLRTLRHIKPHQALGVIADFVESPTGSIAKGIRKLAARGSGGPRAASPNPGANTAALASSAVESPAAAATQAAEVEAKVEAKIVALRKSGLSGAQIANALRDVYGIPPSQGQKLVTMVFDANGLGSARRSSMVGSALK